MTHPLEDHYKALYLKHKLPQAQQAGEAEEPSGMPALLAKADAVLPPILRTALHVADAPQQLLRLEQQATTNASPAKSMMSLAAASRDGIAMYVTPFPLNPCPLL